MPHRSWELRIVDIVDAIETVLDYTAGMILEQFVSDRKTKIIFRLSYRC